jgi:methylaspartate mutase epsilon subunit
VDWHIVLYTYMGLFPESKAGARQLLMDSVRIAVRSGTERLVIKTTAEAHRIPSIGENVAALRLAHRTAVRTTSEAGPFRSALVDTETYLQARFLVNEVRNLAPTMAQALPLAFERGLLDVPYCMHPDNRNESRGVIDADGRLEWWDTGRMPLPASLGGRRAGGRVGADRLLADLAHHRHRLDHGLSITSAGGMT